MQITVKRFHNAANLHVDSGMFLRVYAELDFIDDNTGPTCLRSQMLDWQGVLTFDRPLSPDNAFALSTLYENPRLELIGHGTAWDKLANLPLVPCEIGDVTMTKERVKICAKGPVTQQSLSRLLADYYRRQAEKGGGYE